ncbi:MAG: MATE family efflux transporter [Lachnospiraceae bacterium]|nr:MATE family efflux transporter [Lachnospiraceae bacterium]
MELNKHNFTEGGIFGPLLRFALPVLLALFLQAMYGAVDLMIVGRFTEEAYVSAHVSAVSTGSQIMLTLTNLVASFAMGATILLGQQIGEGKAEKGGETIGSCIVLFLCIGVVLTAVLVPGAGVVAQLMHAPQEAFDLTVSYVRICGAGTLVIIAYNLIGSIFRGIGDSVTPLVTVAIACVCNIAGDLLLVAGFHMGTVGAAIATVFAQAVSVLVSVLRMRKKTLPFTLTRTQIHLKPQVAGRITRLGLPIALQDFLVGVSFLLIQVIVNSLGVLASAGVGVAEKVCAFIMLVPAAFMQSMSAFVAQNAGAGKYDRAEKALRYGILMSLAVGCVMFYVSFFHGVSLASLFAKDMEVAVAGADYLRAYAIDCMLTPIFFCFIGYYNGIGMTRFVMMQGIISAFLVRVPVSFLMSRRVPVSLFHIGLATPASSTLQIIMCLCAMAYVKKHSKR